MNSTYERIEQLCKQHNTNVTKMCRDLRIPRTSLSEMKAGRIKSISADKVAKIADYFGVSALYITDGIVDGENPSEQNPIDIAKIALFGGDVDVTDEMWSELEDFANYIVAKHKKNTNK